MLNAKTFAMRSELRYQGTVTTKDGQGVTRQNNENAYLEIDGLRDASNPAMTRMYQNFTAMAGAEAPLTFVGKYVGVGDARSFHFSQLPGQVGPLHFEELRNRWLRVDVAKLFKDSDLPLVGSDRPALLDKDRAYLLDQFRITPFLRVKEHLKNETVGGVKTHHYQVEPVAIFFKDYYVLAETTRLGRELTNKERDAADVFFSNVTPDPSGCELWMGMRDYNLYRVRMRFNYDNGIGRKGVLTLTANFSHFNEPAVFETPTSGVEDVTAVLQSLLPGLSGHLPMANKGAVQRGGDASVGRLGIDAPQIADPDPDQDGLPNSLEHFYGTDLNNADTDGDGIKDGVEVKAGCNPIGAGQLFSFGLNPDKGRCL